MSRVISVMAWYGPPVSRAYLAVKVRSGFRHIKTCATVIITFWETIYFRKFSTNKIHQGESWRCNHFWRHLQAQITKQLYSERDSKGSSLATSFSRQILHSNSVSQWSKLSIWQHKIQCLIVKKERNIGLFGMKMKLISWRNWIWLCHLHSDNVRTSLWHRHWEIHTKSTEETRKYLWANPCQMYAARIFTAGFQL